MRELPALNAEHESQVFTGTLRGFPGWDAADPSRHDIMREVLCDATGLGLALSPDPDADFEDFWEDAFRASAAVRACEAVGVPLRLSEAGEVPDPSLRLGPVSTAEEGRHCLDALLMPDALLAHGNRVMARAWVDQSVDAVRGRSGRAEMFEAMGSALADEPCPSDFHGALLWMCHRGIDRVVVKSSNRKSGVSLIGVSPRLPDLRGALARDDMLCWGSTPDAAPMDGFLIQEWVPMTYEYRFFVVDGQLVSGAGCVEEFTPLDRIGNSPFDPQIRRTRGNGVASDADSAVELRPDLVRRYRSFLSPIAGALPSEMGTVVVDVALDAGTDKPLIVEFNTLPNSGLYASDVHRTYRSLLRAGHRGYRQRPRETTPTNMSS